MVFLQVEVLEGTSWVIRGTLAPPGPHVVGRDPACAVVITDLRVSRGHAQLSFERGRWVVEDLRPVGGMHHGGAVVRDVVIESPVLIGLGRDAAVQVRLCPTLLEELHGAEPPVDRAPTDGDRPVCTIGRDPDNTLVLGDLAVSRHHARLWCSGQGWWIEDLGSHHGTYVDGHQILATTPVPEGARVAIGSAIFEFTQGVLVLVPDRERLEGLEARNLTVVVGTGQRILDGVSFSTSIGTFLAIVGPTGAGKSTLLKAITGFRPPDAGEVLVDGRGLYANFAELRLQLGYVPQDDILHSQLTVRKALGFGAELRFPEETTQAERTRRVDEVMEELGLTARADLPISRLSGGQRKRTSVALELLTKPRLLFLDEPTSGLDPGYEQSVMELLHDLAKGGRVVAVVTHSLSSLGLCDTVLFLAPGGSAAYCGPPSEVLAHFGLPDYPSVFRKLEASSPPPSRPLETASQLQSTLQPSVADHPAVNWSGQLRTLVRRQFAILLADRRNLIVLSAAPLVPALLILALAGLGALNLSDPLPRASARTLLGALVITAAALGSANGLREIVKERAIYLRERAIGLHRSAYLASKVVGVGCVTVAQCLVLTIVGTLLAGGPGSGNLLPARLELIFDVSLTGLVAVALGLLVSSLVSTSEKAVALIPVVFVASWLFSGIALSLTAKPVLSQLAYLTPANWGVSAAASSADLPALENYPCRGVPTSTGPASTSCDRRWQRGVGSWTSDLAALFVLGSVYLLAADWALARKEPLAAERRQFVLASAGRAVGRRITRARANSVASSPETPVPPSAGRGPFPGS